MRLWDDIKITMMLYIMKPFYRQLQLPENKADWDMGHRCLHYHAKALPMTDILLPSYLWTIYKRESAGLIPPTHVPAPLFDAMINLVNRRLIEIRSRDLTTISVALLKRQRVANCSELAGITYRWMVAQGVNAHWISARFHEGPEEIMEANHQFVMYQTNPNVHLSAKEMMHQINNPDIRICDLWLQKCGTARDILAEYAQLFVRTEYNAHKTRYTPFLSGTSLVLRPVAPDWGVVKNDFRGEIVGVVSDNHQLQLLDKPEDFFNYCRPNRIKYMLYRFGMRVSNTYLRCSDGVRSTRLNDLLSVLGASMSNQRGN